jgi:ABC-type nitrate/sulfonate/bicarbonate transport system permease component
MLTASLGDALASLWRVGFGVALAFALAVLVAFARYSLPESWQRNPWLNFLFEAPRFPPPIAWIPFIILAAGIGEWPALLIVIIGAFFPIFTNAYVGMRNIPRAVIWTARSLELSRTRFFLRVLLPASLPQLLAGLRTGLGMGWMSVIAAEMISGQSGLGYAIQLERMNMQYGAMSLDMVLIAALGYLLSLGMDGLERRCLRWSDVSGSRLC